MRVPLLMFALLAWCAAAAATEVIDVATARAILFEADGKVAVSAQVCSEGTRDDQIGCLIGARFASDARASRVARDLYTRTGSVSGLLPEQDFDGAYRGQLHLVPHLPVKAERRHLEGVAEALLDFDAFFADLEGDAPIRYRWRALDLRFFRSVKRRTPSAYATGWTVAYNVSGSLFTTPARTRETLFHEIFHLNDFAHDTWSAKALADIYQRIVKKCGTRTACLTPYTPDSIIVRGGTYYAFMPDNGVLEYGADLAKRYYVEQRALMHKQKISKPFKCLTPENGEAWQLLVDEFFGGVDRVPVCSR